MGLRGCFNNRLQSKERKNALPVLTKFKLPCVLVLLDYILNKPIQDLLNRRKTGNHVTSLSILCWKDDDESAKAQTDRANT